MSKSASNANGVEPSAIIANGAFAASGQRTYVVFGVPRGGTTMVAGVMRALGVFMGDDVDPANQEDPLFNFHRNAGDLDVVRGAIANRNARFETWGWKFPGAVHQLPNYFDEIRAPHLICVYRDSVANARRGIGRAGLTDFERIDVHIRLMRKNYTFLARSGAPSLSVSYEKALTKPLAFVAELAGHLGVEPDFKAFDFEGFMSPASYKSFDDYRR